MQHRYAISLMHEREETGPDNVPAWIERLYHGQVTWSDVASADDCARNNHTVVSAGSLPLRYADALDIVDEIDHGGFYVGPDESVAMAASRVVADALTQYFASVTADDFAAWLEDNEESCDDCGGHADLDPCTCEDEDAV